MYEDISGYEQSANSGGHGCQHFRCEERARFAQGVTVDAPKSPRLLLASERGLNPSKNPEYGTRALTAQHGRVSHVWYVQVSELSLLHTPSAQFWSCS